jgi:hypothetical protein
MSRFPTTPDYTLPKRFLCGDPDSPFHWRHKVPIERQLADAEWASLDLFRWRAAEFLANICDLDLPNNHTGSATFHCGSNDQNKGSFSTNTWPGRHRAKGIFLDFRPLISKKGGDSRGSFKRVKNIVSRSTSDHTLKAFVEDCDAQFSERTVRFSIARCLPTHLQFRSLHDLIELWFNTISFHSGTPDQVEEMTRLLSIFTGEGIEQLLFFELLGISHDIRCLYAVIHHTAKSNPYFSCPDQQLVQASVENHENARRWRSTQRAAVEGAIRSSYC